MRPGLGCTYVVLACLLLALIHPDYHVLPPPQVNVYKLGAVYLQLTKLLRLEDHPCLTRPIDPCLYIHRCVIFGLVSFSHPACTVVPCGGCGCGHLA